jgi:tRNA(fMet)-specific endonuclease VapC
MSQHPVRAFWLSIVSFHEQLLGANAYINRATTAADVTRGYGLLEVLLMTYSTAQIHQFDQPAIVQFDALRTRRVRIATMDLRIASIALVRKWTVLTRNLRDFQKVPGLRCEDWTI